MNKYLFSAFLLVCLLGLIFDGFSSYKFINELFKTMDLRRKALGDINQFEAYLSKLKDAETGQRGFVITGDIEYLDPYMKALEYLKSAELQNFISQQMENKDASTKEKIKRIKELEQYKLQEISEVIEKRKASGFVHAKEHVVSNNGKKHMDEIRFLVSSILEKENKNLVNLDKEIKDNAHTTLFYFIVGDLVSICLITAGLFYLYSYTKKLEDKEKQLSLASQKLTESLAFRQAILNGVDYAIISCDKKGIIKSFNLAAERMLQYTAEEVIGKTTPEIFHDKQEMEDRAIELSMQFQRKITAGFEIFILLAKRNLSDIQEWTYIRKDKTRFPILLCVTAIKNEQGETIGYVGIASDITERKEIDRMKNELIAITSHELRSPVAAIKGTFQLLSNQELELSEKAKHILEIGKKSCNRLTRLAEDLIDLQQLQTKKMSFYMRKVNVFQFLSKAFEINLKEAEQSNVTLKHQFISPAWVIEGDETRLMQVMNQLISNALRYSRKEGVIEIAAYEVDSRLHVEIKNQGTEISEEFQSKAFDPFARDPSITNAEKKGTGLGLNIAKSIIEKHKGIIGFQNRNYETVFWFELPLAEENNNT